MRRLALLSDLSLHFQLLPAEKQRNMDFYTKLRTLPIHQAGARQWLMHALSLQLSDL